MKFAIGIPTLNRADLLIPSLSKYITDFPNITIHVVDNGNQELNSFENIVVHKQEGNLGVSASWNFLCKKIYDEGNDYALIVNDDVYLGYGTKEVLSVMKEDKIGIVQSYHSWSVFLINKDLYKRIGEFDEMFYPAYYEDSDYIYRLNLKGLRQGLDIRLNPELIRTSQTYEKNPELVNKSMAENKERYIRKWGGLPLLEKYMLPFDGNREILEFLNYEQNIKIK